VIKLGLLITTSIKYRTDLLVIKHDISIRRAFSHNMLVCENNSKPSVDEGAAAITTTGIRAVEGDRVGDVDGARCRTHFFLDHPPGLPISVRVVCRVLHRENVD
jgi:hypothetical protein